jgi:hypothetical protein
MRRSETPSMTSFLKPLIFVCLAASLAGCSSAMDTLMPNQLSQRSVEGVKSHQGPSGEAEKIKLEPLNSNDLSCPLVDIAEGGSNVRIGGPDNKSVRYQIDIGNVSRNCEPRGAEVAIHVGVSGLALVGPAGSPGKFSTDLKVLVATTADKKPVYQKSYKVEVDTAGALHGSFEMVLDPIVLPLTRTDLDAEYELTIGLGNSVSAKPVKVAKSQKNTH